ncbi:MAG: helix-turn-helix transcriptional regulator [Lachnospiraceae bacterium]|nr:helix-turn-helix transcriptional regulator [Lachnospiraceae bacterium]
MEFSSKLYELRKTKGLSQEELANKLNVSRQTVSKWELGDSTPDMEKLTAISDLFEISLDELVLGKVSTSGDTSSKTEDILNVLEEKVLTTENKKKAGKGLKIAGILLGAVLAIDVISMIIYFVLFGVPK